MPLPNRVTPLGELLADPARGLVYGNRGCLHDRHGQITRFSATRRWIACRLEFKDWQRGPKLQPGKFTELFFLDEATAMAAGHRACALCRRQDYNRLRERWGGADAMDARLEAERMRDGKRRLHDAPLEDLPDGVFVLYEGEPWLVLGDRLRRWTPAGYDRSVSRPAAAHSCLITPPSLVEVLRHGWDPLVPLLHPSAV